MVIRLSRIALAADRVLQCVASRGVASSVCRITCLAGVGLGVIADNLVSTATFLHT
jgi:hypothetical protein